MSTAIDHGIFIDEVLVKDGEGVRDIVKMIAQSDIPIIRTNQKENREDLIVCFFSSLIRGDCKGEYFYHNYYFSLFQDTEYCHIWWDTDLNFNTRFSLGKKKSELVRKMIKDALKS